jgi:hypothetical protein
MRLVISTWVAFTTVLGHGLAAQDKPDFSGRWRLIVSSQRQTRGQAVIATAAAELTVRQNARSITVDYSEAGARPEAGTHVFGSRGTVGGRGDQFRSDVFWFGDQLVITTTTADAADADGRQRTVENSELWSLADRGRLVIQFAEARSGTVAQTTRVTYKKR